MGINPIKHVINNGKLVVIVKNSKIFLRAIFLGAVAGIIAYLILAFIHSPWEESLAALFIGPVTGFVEKKKNFALIGLFSCVLGWFMGMYFVGILFEIGLGAWAFAGAALGLASGLASSSLFRSLSGFILGLFAGLIAEASRYFFVFGAGIKAIDMQLLVLLTAGILLPLVGVLVYKPLEKK